MLRRAGDGSPALRFFVQFMVITWCGILKNPLYSPNSEKNQKNRKFSNFTFASFLRIMDIVPCGWCARRDAACKNRVGRNLSEKQTLCSQTFIRFLIGSADFGLFAPGPVRGGLRPQRLTMSFRMTLRSADRRWSTEWERTVPIPGWFRIFPR